MTESLSTRRPAPAWKLWANPIVRRYAQSRIRPQGFGIWLLITLLIAGFIFFVSRTVAYHRVGLEMVDADRAPLIPLFVLQGVILFLLGTGTVAAAMTAEGDEGVLDYQRLAPMTPLAKVFGYLFGLPIREYLLCFATFPFTLWSLWKGAVPFPSRGGIVRNLLLLGHPLSYDWFDRRHRAEKPAVGLSPIDGRRLSSLHDHSSAG